MSRAAVTVCKYRRDSTCSLANALIRGHCASDSEVTINDDAFCEVCVTIKNRRPDQEPQSLNMATAHLIWNVDRTDDCLTWLAQPHMNPPGSAMQQMSPGPGRWTHWLLESLGYGIAPNCQCLKIAAQMNKWGALGTMKRLPQVTRAMLAEYRARRVERRHEYRLPDVLVLPAAVGIAVAAASLALLEWTWRKVTHAV